MSLPHEVGIGNFNLDVVPDVVALNANPRRLDPARRALSRTTPHRAPHIDHPLMSGARVLLLCVGLAGCSTTQVYPGPKLPPEQVAHLNGTHTFYVLGGSTILVTSIDGQEELADAKVQDHDYVGDLELLPGVHTITVSYELDILAKPRRSVAPCVITFRAEAGHSYIVDGTSLPKGEVWRCWIEDAQTNERTDGTFHRARDNRLWPIPDAPQRSPPK